MAEDLEAAVRDDGQRLRSWPYLRQLEVGDFVYSVETGRLTRLS